MVFRAGFCCLYAIVVHNIASGVSTNDENKIVFLFQLIYI